MTKRVFEFGAVTVDELRGRIVCGKCGKNLVGDDIAAKIDNAWCCADCCGEKTGVRPILARTLEEIVFN